jgi:hypothetical protein
MGELITIEGVAVRYDPQTGRIFWSDNWVRVDELREEGKLGRTFARHLYGHTDYFVPEFLWQERAK